MAKTKYSVPANYNIVEMNGCKGIMRHDKKGDKWTWDPFYSAILVGKSYGKILVAYREAISTDPYLKVASYNKQEHMPIKAYDIMFGENCLYIKTPHPKTGDLQWCLVREDLGGGTFLGDFEFMGRSREMPFHIPIGTTEMSVKLEDGKLKKLKLISGVMEDDSSLEARVERPKVEEPPVTHYNILIDKEGKRLKLLSAADNRLIKESTCVGELEQYEGIIKALLGSMENVEKETAELLVAFLSKFEHYVHGMVIPLLYKYVKDRSKQANTKELLNSMIKEATTGWFIGDNNKEFKIYTQGTIILAMSKLSNGKITVAPYMINEGDDLLNNDEMLALVNCYRSNGFNTAKLDIKLATMDEAITDLAELSQWPSPYSVQQRVSFASDIKQFIYKEIDIYVLTGTVTYNSTNGESIKEEITISVALCENFTYKSKKKVNGKLADWIKTNTSAAQIV